MTFDDLLRSRDEWVLEWKRSEIRVQELKGCLYEMVSAVEDVYGKLDNVPADLRHRLVSGMAKARMALEKG